MGDPISASPYPWNVVFGIAWDFFLRLKTMHPKARRATNNAKALIATPAIAPGRRLLLLPVETPAVGASVDSVDDGGPIVAIVLEDLVGVAVILGTASSSSESLVVSVSGPGVVIVLLAAEETPKTTLLKPWSPAAMASRSLRANQQYSLSKDGGISNCTVALPLAVSWDLPSVGGDGQLARCLSGRFLNIPYAPFGAIQR